MSASSGVASRMMGGMPSKPDGMRRAVRRASAAMRSGGSALGCGAEGRSKMGQGARVRRRGAAGYGVSELRDSGANQ